MMRLSVLPPKLFLLLFAMLAFLVSAQGALATKPSCGLGGCNNKIAESAYIKQNTTHEALTDQEAEFWKDMLEYEDLQHKIWPLCFESGDTDIAPSCKKISAEELAASYPDETIGGLGARFRVSPKDRALLQQREIELQKKWMSQQ